MRHAHLHADFSQNLGPMHIENVSFGQGGLSPDPMWEDRVPEIRALNPGLIRFWIQEYFCLDRDRGVYDFAAIDRSLDMILRTGGTPLISLNIKPQFLYPEINEKIIEPNDVAAWDDFIRAFVQRYVERGLTGWYWEVIGEANCGEGGGCPFLVTPENYPPFYAHTARAILAADPTAHVGGPGLAGVDEHLNKLCEYCTEHQVPLHFFSYHYYSCNPLDFRALTEKANAILSNYPSLAVETILDEWSICWANPEARDPRVLPCLVPETVWHMNEAGLDHSCYYHIRDYHVEQRHFEAFFTHRGAAFMARWWNRMPQYGGLFDYQNTVRPVYFSFKLVKRLVGDRLMLTSDDGAVHGLLTYDDNYRLYSLMYWNYAPEPVELTLTLDHLPLDLHVVPFVLDPEGPSNDENRRIRPLDEYDIHAGTHTMTMTCQPYGVHFCYLTAGTWNI